MDGDIDKYPMGCVIPDQLITIDNKFTREVIDFLKFKAGRIFENCSLITEDWLKMIWDLLHIACSSCSRKFAI